MFSIFHKKKEPFTQSAPAQWKAQWQSLVPPECRDVPVEVDGKTVVAYVKINHFVMMMQDGLKMQQSFFPVCDHFLKSGYHLVWLMRCTQDIERGFLRLRSSREHGYICQWDWKKPTTNFGRWTSDNRNVTIILQTAEVEGEDLRECEEKVLQRVQWANSDDNAETVPGRTHFMTTGDPASPKELAAWLHGGFLTGAYD